MQDLKTQAYFDEWTEREAIAERMIPLIGQLYRQCGVVVTIFDRSLVLRSPIDILKAHRFTRHMLARELSLQLSWNVLEALSKMELAPSRIDIGRLAGGFLNLPADSDIDAYVRGHLAEVNGQQAATTDPQDIVLYGFGRIGRMLARILIERSGGGDKWRLRAIVVNRHGPGDLQKRASLLRRDSVHGSFKGTIQIDEEENGLVINGNLVRLLYAESPDCVDYTAFGISNAIVIDNSGMWRDRKGLGMHLASQRRRQSHFSRRRAKKTFQISFTASTMPTFGRRRICSRRRAVRRTPSYRCSR